MLKARVTHQVALLDRWHRLPEDLRFGVVAPLTTDLPTWRDRVRRGFDHGWGALVRFAFAEPYDKRSPLTDSQRA